MDMLQTVMRPSIDSARMASPAYSMTLPVPPAVPISPMMARMMSFAVTPAGNCPSTVTRMFFAFFWISVCVASTCSTSRGADAVGERAERAMGRGVAVAADDRGSRQGEALLRPDDVDDALPLVELVEIFDAELARILGQRSTCVAASGSAMPCERSVVGTLWSTTASVFFGARTLRPVMRRPSKACGLVTSCTRWRSI